jgi:hypothetical protein
MESLQVVDNESIGYRDRTRTLFVSELGRWATPFKGKQRDAFSQQPPPGTLLLPGRPGVVPQKPNQGVHPNPDYERERDYAPGLVVVCRDEHRGEDGVEQNESWSCYFHTFIIPHPQLELRANDVR